MTVRPAASSTWRCPQAGRSRVLVARLASVMLAAVLTAALSVTASTLPAAAAGPAMVARDRSAAGAVSASAAGSFIVRARPGQLDGLCRALADRGLRPGRRIAIIDAVTVWLPAGVAQALRGDPRVISVTTNSPVSLASTAYDPAGDTNSLASLGTLTGARSWWANFTGQGVDVALVDSGVAPVTGLDGIGKVLNGPDLTPESQNSDTRYLDTNGHGTHMAGIIAGHDPGASVSAANTSQFLGVAPNARIVSVKVADARGNSDVSQVIAGIDWVVQHAHDPGMNVRALNLSFGTNSTQVYTLDPLAYAVEVAWKAGIVVVVSAGNDGTTSGRLTNPAIDPFVIAVGADDLNGTAGVGDDTVPAFSSRGDGIRNPDLVAPGVHVQSLRVPGSYIDSQYAATGAIDARYFRGSGTSQSAAFVTGAVALLLQKYPALTPDQAKAMLKATGRSLEDVSSRAQGRGLINLTALAAAAVPAVAQTWTASTGTGSLEASRGDAHLVLDGVELSGEKDIMGAPFNAASMAAAEAAGRSWSGGSWNSRTWAGSTWAGSSWAGSSWAGSSWAGSSWASRTWATGTWTGSSWAGSSWAGSSWAGSSWAANAWAGRCWSQDIWS